MFYNRASALSFGSYGTLAQWRTATTSDAHSLNVDPKFVNLAGYDFHLLASSPAIGAGTNGSDIGAFAYNPDTSPPTVALTAPTAGATVAGTMTVTATASDNVGVTGVQFKLDGGNLGSEDTVAPYSVTWNTTGLVDGSSHVLTAVAHDAIPNSTTSSMVTVTVNNACVEDWTTIPCIGWSTCDNGTQTRTCTDAHDCNTTVNRPPLSQSCTMPADTTPPAAITDLRAS